MTVDPSATGPRRPTWQHRVAPVALITVAAVTSAYVMQVVSHHTIDAVRAQHLLPRWDLATHLGHGWLDYHLLVTGQIHRFLSDLWLQGYWPPGLSLWQVPFYLVLGGELTSGLWSSAAAFVLTVTTGVVVLWRQWRTASFLPASVFLALLLSSPFLLAYAFVTMTEMLGALAQLVVLLCYQRYREDASVSAARLFALSLTTLFFVKYNYFVLLVAPLLVHEWLERTSGWSGARRVSSLWRHTRRVLSSPSGAFVALYLAALLIVLGGGGFETRLLGQRISMRSIGNTGHVVLYILLARLWYLHRRGRIDWARLTAADPRVRPLLVWFVVPVAIWLASPYPNHIRDVANLVINRPLGEPTVGAGVSTYLDALAGAYFYTEWTLAFVVAVFAAAAVRYRRQPPLMKWLIVAVPLQFAAIAAHQTRFPRFLLLTVVLLCLTAASEIGRWVAGARSGRLVAGLLAPFVVASGVIAARGLVSEQRFRAIASEHYVFSEPLRQALDSIRADLSAADRLLVVGQTDQLSPALFRWELGPPAGVARFPFPLGGTGRLDPALATKVLLVLPLGSGFPPINVERHNPARLGEIRDRIDRGDLAIRRDIPLEDMQVSLRLYGRTSPPQ